MKTLLLANTDWYLYNFRLPLARALEQTGHEVVLVSPPGKYAEKLKDAGLRWLPFAFSRRGMNPFAEVITIARLTRLYRAEQPDVAHHFTIKCVLYGSLAARFARVPGVINAITGLGYVFVNRGVIPRLLKPGLRLFYRATLDGTQVIFQNPDDLEAFLRMGLAQPGQTSLIRSSGVDLARFVPGAEIAGDPLVVLPGRLLWDKGVAEFVSAARLVKAHGLRARFALVGDSDPANPAAVPLEEISAWQQEGVIEWWGWRDDMPAVLAQSSIVCLPSYREGAPKSLLEASACARPVVATQVPGCREVVIDGETGLLVAPRDAAALAEALSALITDPQRRADLGAAGRALVERAFSAESIAAQTLRVYSKLQEGAHH